MEFSLTALALLIAAASFLASAWKFCFSLSQRTSKLIKPPPGNFTLPVVGETLSLLKSSFHEFVVERRERFGDIFSSHVYGLPTIFLTTAEDAKFFLASTGGYCSASKFRPSREIIGEDQVHFVNGAMHVRYRKIFQRALLPEVLKHQVEWIDKLAVATLNSWESKTHVNTHEETVKFAYNVIAGFICEDLRLSTDSETVRMKKDVAQALGSIMALPLKLPCTKYWKALKARERIRKHLERLMERRRRSSEEHNDLLQALIGECEDGYRLTNKQVENNMLFGVLAGHHTVSISLVWVMKRIEENADVLQKVKEEHRTILARRVRETGADAVTWEDTKQMSYTLQVINETLRVTNVARILSRQIAKDVEYKGYLFPKGWQVIVTPSSIHLDDENFSSPTIFDPSRFTVAQKSGSFIPFGMGSRICPGSELAKLEILIFIHRLVTLYSWKPTDPKAKAIHWPSIMLENGYEIQVQKEN